MEASELQLPALTTAEGLEALAWQRGGRVLERLWNATALDSDSPNTAIPLLPRTREEDKTESPPSKVLM